MSGATKIYVLVLCLSAQHLRRISVDTLSICDEQPITNIDEITLEGSEHHDNCLCQLEKFVSHAQITIKVTNFTCSKSEGAWKLLFLVDGCERFVVDCQTTWSSVGVRHNIPAESNLQNLEVQLVNRTENSAEIHYSVTITAGADMETQCGLPVDLSQRIPEEQCPTPPPPPPKETTLCTQITIESSEAILQDSITQGDCVCDIDRQGDTHGFEIHITNLTCNNTEGHWTLLVFGDDCKYPEFLCGESDTNWQSAVISVQPEISKLYVHLTNNGQLSSSITYEIRIYSTHELTIQCGLDSTVLTGVSTESCSTTSVSPSQTTGTGSLTTDAQSPGTDIVTEQIISTSHQNTSPTSVSLSQTTGTRSLTTAAQSPGTDIVTEQTISTFDRNTSSTASTAAQKEEKKMNTVLIIGVIAAGVAFLVSLAIVVIIIAIRRRRKRKHPEDDINSAHENTYTRELPTEDKNPMSNHKEYQETGNSGNQPNPNQNGSKTDSFPLHDLFTQPNKQAKSDTSPSTPSTHDKHVSANTEDMKSYAYYNQIVDDQFGFIHNDLYSGGLYSK